ncbi:MAG: type II toxin-antitoxin system PemK/MazF family toxin [Acidimicrobiaceae bacterium]|nr:type II toxin-antitoxin system PemK/MazF family toxin [Acidimicrobiaceae bacterium]
MNRGEVWWAELGRKRRPVVILTRPEVIDVRELLTVAELTTAIRGLTVEVPVDRDEAGVSETTVVNCDGIYTLRRSMLSNRVGKLSDPTMLRICRSLTYVLGC